MTPQNAYRLIPLEQLYRCKKGTFNWGVVEATSAFPDVKQGLAEEIVAMLYPGFDGKVPLVDLSMTFEFTKLGTGTK